MATQFSAIDPMLSSLSPSELAMLEQPQAILWDGQLRSPEARALVDLGESRLAERLEACGRTFDMHKYPDGCVIRRNHSACGLRGCCESCPRRRSKEYVEKYLRAKDFCPPSFLYVELSLHVAPERSAVKAFASEVSGSVARLSRRKTFALINLSMRFRNGGLPVKIIFFDVHLINQIKSAWPEARVRVLPRRLYGEILTEMFEPDLAPTPLERARMEILFRRVHLTRAVNVVTDLSVREESTLTEKPVAKDPSPDPIFPPRERVRNKSRLPRCPHGYLPTHVSDPLPRNATPNEISRVQWHEIGYQGEDVADHQ
jgi:hypothetical protein